MANFNEYTSRASAVRGLARMGVKDADAVASLIQRAPEGTKFFFDADAVNELLAAAKRGDEVVAGNADKGEVAGNAASSDARAQMGSDEFDDAMKAEFGYADCPSCGIHLSNGVLDFDGFEEDKIAEHGKVKGKLLAYELQQHEWACMACNAEWGKAIDAPRGAKAAKAPKVKAEGSNRSPYLKSDVADPRAVVFSLADASPDAKRKDIVAKAIEMGVTPNTANAQYQVWRKARGLVKAKVEAAA
jgi:hypothetical protein